MENIISIELKARGYNVDVRVVEYRHLDKNGKDVRAQLEVDFVANDGGRTYIGIEDFLLETNVINK